MTMPEFLEARYGCRALRVLSALIIFVFLVPYSASVYMGLSYLFEVNLGISYVYALTLMAVLTGVYLMMGGYFALTLTDFLRGIVEIFGCHLMVVFLIDLAGGFGPAWDQAWRDQLPGLRPGQPARHRAACRPPPSSPAGWCWPRWCSSPASAPGACPRWCRSSTR